MVAKKVGKSRYSLRRVLGAPKNGKNPNGGIGNGKGKDLGGKGEVEGRVLASKGEEEGRVLGGKKGKKYGWGHRDGLGRRKHCRGQRNEKGKNLGGEGRGRRKSLGIEKRKRSR